MKARQSKLAKKLFTNGETGRKILRQIQKQNHQIYHNPNSSKYQQHNNYDPIELAGKMYSIRPCV